MPGCWNPIWYYRIELSQNTYRHDFEIFYMFYSVECYFHVDLLTELARREKDAGIFPEPEVDLFMKVYNTLH